MKSASYHKASKGGDAAWCLVCKHGPFDVSFFSIRLLVAAVLVRVLVLDRIRMQVQIPDTACRIHALITVVTSTSRSHHHHHHKANLRNANAPVAIMAHWPDWTWRCAFLNMDCERKFKCNCRQGQRPVKYAPLSLSLDLGTANAPFPFPYFFLSSSHCNYTHPTSDLDMDMGWTRAHKQSVFAFVCAVHQRRHNSDDG